MKYIILFLLLPLSAIGQDEVLFDKVFNVYRKETSVIAGYAEDFAKNELPKGYTPADTGIAIPQEYLTGAYIKDGDDIISKRIFYFHKSGKKCFGNMYVYGELLIQAKENRTRIAYANVRYISLDGKTDCPLQGSYADLKACKECWATTDYLRTTLLTQFGNLAKDYHNYLKKRDSKDRNNW